jgi:hypothetical protein
MKSQPSAVRVRAALIPALAAAVVLPLLYAEDKAPAKKPPARSEQAWKVDEALAHLKMFPNDSYVQYVTLQLANREGKIDIAQQAESIIMRNVAPRRNERVSQVDLFSLFTGALAVQESLQLDAMRGQRPGRGPRPGGPDHEHPVAVTDLKGPTIKSHPWEKMLAGKKPDVGPLARCVPDDYYFIEFRSLTKMLDAMDLTDLWGTHLFNQAGRDARTQQVGERLKEQLALETNPLLRPVYDLVVDGAAVTGSDLFLREGSDVTLVFRMKNAETFKGRMDGFLARSERAHPEAKKTTGEYLGVPYVHLSTPDRAVSVYSAYPTANLHVRSNSQVAFERVLQAVHGKGPDGKAVTRLGDTAEFQYIRTLMPRGAKEEDGFVYLSDPFIRRLMGPAVKLTERRRMLCYNHVRMLGHAMLLYRTEQGKPATSLEDLDKGKCLPGKFNEGLYACPDGGKYSLMADGTTPVCSHHGHARFLTPCCERPVSRVTTEEADEYRAFLNEYNQYWRMYFDPIALRLQITPQRYRMETIVLPLIDNSIYTQLAASLGGEPEPLDALPVPKRNIFSVAVRVNKEGLARHLDLPLAPMKPGAAEQVQNANNLRQIGLGIHNYVDANNWLPTAASYDKQGKPLLSWRVHLLPYLDQDDLYKQFKLDEPWDSAHNKKLIARMPAIYRCPGSKAAEGKTTYLAPVGADTMFPGGQKRLRFPGDVQDGTSNTIMAIDADDKQAVEWTKPDDLKYDPKDPFKGLAVRDEDAFLALFGDGSVQAVRKTIAKETLQPLFTRNGNEVVNLGPADARAVGGDDRRAFLDIPGVSPQQLAKLNVEEFLTKGIGNQLGMHVYDSVPTFDFNLPQFLGMTMGTFGGRRLLTDETELLVSFLITALNAPVYIAVPVKDAKVVDRFLEGLDPLMASGMRQVRERGFIDFALDFYKAPLKSGGTMRVANVQVGPIKWRLFYARIGDGLYIASKSFILDDLAALEAAKEKSADKGPAAHAMVKVRPQNWDRVLADYKLAWAESNREACLNNLGPVASVGRALVAGGTGATPKTEEQLGRVAHHEAGKLFGVHFFCPEGGHYLLSADGKTCRCSVHGTATDPRQAAEPSDRGSSKSMKDLAGVTATLMFLEDGLHAVVVIDRKP